MAIFDPRLWFAILILTVSAFAGGNWHGAREANKAAALAEAGRTATALAALVKENDKELAIERDLRSRDRARFDTYTTEKDHAKIQDDRLIADLRRDVVRLRVPIHTDGKAAPDPARPAVDGAGNDGYAELGADAAVFLVELLARGDAGIRKHAEVVGAYARLRAACMQEPLDTLP